MATTDAAKQAVHGDPAAGAVTIAPDPHRPGPAFARLVEVGRPVWTIIAHLQGVDWDVARTAEAFAIPPEAVQAAIDFYHADPRPIDAWLLLNRGAFDF